MTSLSRHLISTLLAVPLLAQAAAPVHCALDLPDGNYLVTVTLTASDGDARAYVFAESRRLMAYDEPIGADEARTFTFCVNKRDSVIRDDRTGVVRIKANEREKLNWDSQLSLDIVGDVQCESIKIDYAPDTIPTIWLCGNSTVVDQDADPWASWGQMVTSMFGPQVCFANMAESGESASTFIDAGRWAKVTSMLRPGDYVMIEFGHNDQKQRWPGAGAYYNFSTALKTMIDETRAAGATPVLVTPTCRRSFDADGHITPTHGDYPAAMRQVAEREGVALIDLQQLTKQLYEALGVEGSKAAFVHYPAGTFAGQDQPLADNTHFNPYGAYQIARLVVHGMIDARLPIVAYLSDGYKPIDAAHPDDPATMAWPWADGPMADKPDGN